MRELNAESKLWDVLVDPARKIRIGNKLYFGDDDNLVAEVIDNTTSRGRTLRFLFDGTSDEFREVIEQLGIRHYQNTSSVKQSLPIKNVIKQYLLRTKELLLHQLQDCISVVSY